MELVHAPASPRVAAASPEPNPAAPARPAVLRDLIAAANAGASLTADDHAIWEDACRRLAAEQRPEPVAAASAGGPATLLVIAASARDRESLQQPLRAAGYKVIAAEDGAKALALARETRANLIVTDLDLPGTDGLALIAQLRALHRSTPILMLTGASQDSRKVAGYRAGATGWIAKPVALPRLVAIIQQLCPT